jgi:hypothetical protein
VKGKEKEVDICELLWTDHDEATTMVAHRDEDAPQATRLSSPTASAPSCIPTTASSLVLGRDASADLVIADKMASRAHCEIEVRQGKFVIATAAPTAPS